MRVGKGIVGCHWQIKCCYFENLEVYIMDKVETGIKGNTVPIWEKYMSELPIEISLNDTFDSKKF